MYYAMVFHKDPYNPMMSTVRPIRKAPYKTLGAAQRAIEKVGHTGYIKQLGIGVPVWHNVIIPFGDKRIRQVLEG